MTWWRGAELGGTERGDLGRDRLVELLNSARFWTAGRWRRYAELTLVFEYSRRRRSAFQFGGWSRIVFRRSLVKCLSVVLTASKSAAA